MNRVEPPRAAGVLVVDERPAARDALCDVVARAGLAPVASRIGDALDAVARHQPRVAVVSIPGPDGAEAALASILTRRAPGGPRVIAVCPDRQDALAAAYAAGAHDVLTEPVRPAEAAARLCAALGDGRTHASAGPDAALPASVAGAMAEGLLLFGPDGAVRETNAAFTRLVGRPGRDLVGRRPPFPWWPADQADDITRRVAEAVAVGGGLVHAKAVRADGSAVPVEMQVAAERSGGGYAVVVRDLSDVIRHRNAMQIARREHASMRRVATAVASESDVDRVFGLVANEVADVFGVECCVVVRFVNDVAVVCGAPSPGAFVDAGAVLPAEFDAAVARVVATSAPARVAYEYVGEPDAGAVARAAGIVCSIAAPVRVGGRLWGAVLIATADPGGIADERARLAGFADMAGLALETAETRSRLEMVSTIDELTALPNRRGFDDALVRETERARRYGRALTLVMFDIDRLGQLNAALGHDVGDEAIARFGSILTDSCRLTDLVARTDGAEFACLMPDTEGKWGTLYAERVRAAVAAARIPGGLTCSAGVAQWRDAEDPEALVARAGQALYRAKHQGRDRVLTADARAA